MSGKIKVEAKNASRAIKKDQREIEREIASLQRDEKKLINEIKVAAKRPGGDAIVKTMAKELIRNRNTQTKLHQMSGKMGAVSAQVTTMASTAAISQTIQNSTKVMSKMNAAVDVKQMSKNMQEFGKQNEIMGMKEELMEDAMDMLDDEDLEIEQDEVLGSIMDEIGLELSGKMVSAPTTKQPVKQSTKTQSSDYAFPNIPAN
eukprot:c14838_g1_i1.p1 GENE.c14838_g1_i1~~c14838_g1_i1.p1  ORF type:complete len:203 (-),score=84.04 c14838_g1_i1:23-631(-)